MPDTSLRPPTPEEFRALNAAIRRTFEEIAAGKQHIEDDECWPGFISPSFRRIEKGVTEIDLQADILQGTMERLMTLLDHLQYQRDMAIAMNRQLISLLNELPAADAEIIMWLISALAAESETDRSYWMQRAIAALKLMRQLHERP